jgi:hypothetical protein
MVRIMIRDKILREKDRVQKQMWREAGGSASVYVELVHKRAQEIKRASSRKTVAV